MIFVACPNCFLLHNVNIVRKIAGRSSHPVNVSNNS